MLFHQHIQDTAVWPCEAAAYERAIRDVQGDDADDRFCLRLVDRAEHGWAAILPAQPGAPAPATAYIDYRGMVEQGLGAWISPIDKMLSIGGAAGLDAAQSSGSAG
jgi:hypothetical protein